MRSIFKTAFILTAASLIINSASAQEYPVIEDISDPEFETIPVKQSGQLTNRIVLVPNRGAISPNDTAVIINTNEALSVQVGEFYKNLYGIPESNIVRTSFSSPEISDFTQFGPVLKDICTKLPKNTKGIAISFTKPIKLLAKIYVNQDLGTSITRLLSGGIDSCLGNNKLPAFPLTPASMISVTDFATSQNYLTRSKQAQSTFPNGNGAIPSRLTFTNNNTAGGGGGALAPRTPYWEFIESAENIKNYWSHADGFSINLIDDSALVPAPLKNVLFNVHQGGVHNNYLHQFSPGSVLYNLPRSAVDVVNAKYWIEKFGAAMTFQHVEPSIFAYANYGSASRSAMLFLENYFMGSSAVYAAARDDGLGNYLTLGDPLARPFGPAVVNSANGLITVTTSALKPGRIYALYAGSSPETLTQISQDITIEKRSVVDMQAPDSGQTVFKITDKGYTKPKLTITPKEMDTWVKNLGYYNVYVEPYENVKSVTIFADGLYAGTANVYSNNDKYFSGFVNGKVLSDGPHLIKIQATDIYGSSFYINKEIWVSNSFEQVVPGIEIDTPSENQVLGPDSIVKGRILGNAAVPRITAVIRTPDGRKNASKQHTVEIPFSREFSFRLGDMFEGEKTPVAGNSYNLEMQVADLNGAHQTVKRLFSYQSVAPKSTPIPNVTPGPNPTQPPAGNKKIEILSPAENAVYKGKLKFDVSIPNFSEVESVTIQIGNKFMKTMSKLKKANLKASLSLKDISAGKNTMIISLKYKNGKKAKIKRKFLVIK